MNKNKRLTLKFKKLLSILLTVSIVTGLTTGSAYATLSASTTLVSGEAACISTDDMALATFLGSSEQVNVSNPWVTYEYSIEILNDEQALVGFDFTISNGTADLHIETLGYGDITELIDGRTHIAGKLRGEVMTTSICYRIIVVFQKIIGKDEIFAGVTVTPISEDGEFGSPFFIDIGHPIIARSDIKQDPYELNGNSYPPLGSGISPTSTSPSANFSKLFDSNKSMSFGGVPKNVNSVTVNRDTTLGNVVLVDVSSNTSAFYRYVDNYLTTVVDSVSIRVGGASSDSSALVSGFHNLPDDFYYTAGGGEQTKVYSSLIDFFVDILLWKFELIDVRGLASSVRDLYTSSSGSISIRLHAGNRYGQYTYDSNFSRFLTKTWTRFDDEPLSVSFRLGGLTAGNHKYEVTTDITYLILSNDDVAYTYHYVDAPTLSQSFSVSVPRMA